MKQNCNKMRQSWDFFYRNMCYDTNIKFYQNPPSFYKEIANRGYLFLLCCNRKNNFSNSNKYRNEVVGM